MTESSNTHSFFFFLTAPLPNLNNNTTSDCTSYGDGNLDNNYFDGLAPVH